MRVVAISDTHAPRRRQPHGTLGLLTIEAGRLLAAEIVPVA